MPYKKTENLSCCSARNTSNSLTNFSLTTIHHWLSCCSARNTSNSLTNFNLTTIYHWLWIIVTVMLDVFMVKV